METHFYTTIFFFSLDFSYEHAEKLPTIFFVYAPLVFLENEYKNNFEIREGTIVNVKPCFALLKLRILSLIAALSSSQHSLAL